MRVSASACLAVLSAAVAPVAAWEITAYQDTYTCFAKEDTQYRNIWGDSNSGCLTFGRDMPGTGCRKYWNGGANNGACDGESFSPESFLVKPGTQCLAYHDDNCSIGSTYMTPDGDLPRCSNAIGLSSTIRSFQCVNI